MEFYPKYILGIVYQKNITVTIYSRNKCLTHKIKYNISELMLQDFAITSRINIIRIMMYGGIFMNDSVLSALVSGGSGLLGAIIGVLTSGYYVNKQIKVRRKEIEIQEQKKEKTIVKILTGILWAEIHRNHEIIISNKREYNAGASASKYNRFIFDDYNKIKYELVKYDIPLVWEVIDLYNLLIDNKVVNGHECYNEFVKKFEEKKEKVLQELSNYLEEN